ncbi:unnamed protein product [Hydatigera taeniaeformis]|uniref:Secreted protein n=1 Tax=Hydatigena taeniaeformis TaxID=6205 RepID=A0A0R3X9B1_HYDTA|nr:unnamed protein product [Hydatigera taeniaeformis]
MQSASTLICLCLLLPSPSSLSHRILSLPPQRLWRMRKRGGGRRESAEVGDVSDAEESDDVVADVFEMQSLGVSNEAEENEYVLIPAKPRRR